MHISENQTIKDILEKYPETFSVFSAYGFHAETGDELVKKLGGALLLRTALRVIGVNQELFIRKLEEKITEKTDTGRDTFKNGVKLYA
jgi:hypothetical protein